MAKASEKVRQRGLDIPSRILPFDPAIRGAQKVTKALDRKLQNKGAFFESNLAKQQRKAEATKKTQETKIGKQRQAEELRLAQAESDIGQRKLLRRLGGRQSLIASK